MPLAIGALLGGVIGSSIGGLFGASLLGWAVGSLIGQMLFAPSNDQVFTGPRLENTSPAVSNIIGSPIQFAYGTVRVPGNIIWSNSITEKTIVDKQESGGSSGGGSSSTTITYEYYLDFAVAICEGPIIGIKKIWANNKLIYDQDGSPRAEPWLNYVIYNGSETQEADPYMRSIQIANGDITSSDTSPGYRGLSYVVFKQFDLKGYGNRAPYNIDFEVVASGSSSYPTDHLFQSGISDSYIGLNGHAVVEIGETPYFFFGTHGLVDGWAIRVNPYDYNDITVLPTPNSIRTPKYIHAGNIAYTTNLRKRHTLIGLNNNGDFVTNYVSATSSIHNDDPSEGDYYIALIDKSNEVIADLYGGAQNNGSFLWYNFRNFIFNKYYVTVETETGWHRYKFINCDYTFGVTTNRYSNCNVEAAGDDQITGWITNYRIAIDSERNGGYYRFGVPILRKSTWELSKRATIVSSKEDGLYPGEADGYSLLVYKFTELDFYDQDYDNYTFKINVEPWFYLEIPDYPSANPNPPCSNPQLKYTAFEEFETPWTMIQVGTSEDPENATGWWVYFKGKITAGSSNGYPIWAYVPEGATAPTEWYESPYSTTTGYTGIAGINGYYDLAESKYTHYLDGYVTEFNFSTKLFTRWNVSPTPSYNWTEAFVKGSFGKWLSGGWGQTTPDSYNVYEYDLNNISSTDPTLEDIVDDLSDRANLPVAQRDYSDLSTIYVKGFAVRERETARKSIEDVTYPYFVDPVVSDWILKYVKRGPNALTTIPTDDLGCVEGEGYEEPYTITYPDENTLPKEIDFRYLSRLNNYQTAHQRAAKHSRATTSEDKATVNTYVVLDEGYAKEAAIKFLKNMWVNGKRLSIKLPKKYAYLEPTDLIQIFTKTGISVIARIVEIFNTYNILEVSAELEYYDLYESLDYSDYAASFDTSATQKIPYLAQMVTVPVDAYPLFDLYDEPETAASQSFIYLAGTSYFSSWPGGAIHFSENDQDYTIGPRITDRASIGTLNVEDCTILTDVENPTVMDVYSSFVVDFGVTPTGVATITKEELLAGGKNLFYIKNNSAKGEIIAAQTVSVSDSTYTFTNLLRGRYNTNTSAYDTSGAIYQVVHLDSNIVQGEMPWGVYDNTYYYKPVTTGANYNLVASSSQYYKAYWNDTIPPVNIEIVNSSGDLVLTWEIVSKYAPTNMFGNNDDNISGSVLNLNCRVEILNNVGTVVRTIDDITTKTYTYTSADMTTDSITLSTDGISFRLYNKSYMKGYDVEYVEVPYFDASMDLEARINSVVDADAELLYDFRDTLGNTTTQWDDVVDSATNTTLVQDNGGTVSKTALSKIDRNKVVPVIEKTQKFSTTSTTAGASGTNFSFVFLVEANTVVNSHYRLLTRTLSGAYGSHSYGIQVDSQGEYNVLGDVGTGYSGIAAGEPIMVAITNAATQIEKVYINGVKLDEVTASSFISSWGNDFEFGDTELNTNWASGGEVTLYLFAYWNNKVLSDTEITSLYNLWQNGGLKV